MSNEKLKMTQTAALCKALLAGEILSILTGFILCGCTNVPREIGRSIERKFGLVIDRERVEAKNRYGNPCSYVKYSLNRRKKENNEGIKKMTAYVLEHENYKNSPKTDKERKLAERKA